MAHATCRLTDAWRLNERPLAPVAGAACPSIPGASLIQQTLSPVPRPGVSADPHSTSFLALLPQPEPPESPTDRGCRPGSDRAQVRTRLRGRSSAGRGACAVAPPIPAAASAGRS
jgi:hypothetical protein